MQNDNQQRQQAKVEDSRTKSNTALLKKDQTEKINAKENHYHNKAATEINHASQENGVVSHALRNDKNQMNGETKPKDRPKDLPQSLVYKSKFSHPKGSTETKGDSQPDDDGLVSLGQEVEEGNVEYKLKLVDPTPERFQHLVSQLKWRLAEGQGEALYEIGVEDNGFPKGLSEEELAKSKATLERMAKELNCEVSLVCERQGKQGKIAEMLVRELREDRYLDIRIAVCGNVDSGKSTLIGVLTKGQLDNGRGLMRVNVFNHKHEVESGRTSSISTQILGFNSKGECVNHSPLHNMTWGDIIENSYKVISFLDLAGHEKYLKTTVSGMTGHMPDYCFLLVGSNMGVTRMTKEHLGLALALKIPIIIIVTKIDICPENILKQTLDDIQRILKIRGVRKMAVVVKNEDDLITCIKSVHNDRLVPIFLLSSVTGENLNLLQKFLNMIPPRIQWDILVNGSPEVLIDQTYFVTGVGTVVGGTVMSGVVSVNQNMLLGPDGNGLFIPVQVKSVHTKRMPVKQAYAGQSAGFALKKVKRSLIRKGMVMVDISSKPKATWSFEADVIILYHSTTIHTNYQPVIQCMTMRQSAKITHIFDREVLRTGDRARVRFKFLYHPEYLKEGMRIIFREGRCKGIGIIAKVNCEDVDTPSPSPSTPNTTANTKGTSEETNDITAVTNKNINNITVDTNCDTKDDTPQNNTNVSSEKTEHKKSAKASIDEMKSKLPTEGDQAPVPAVVIAKSMNIEDLEKEVKLADLTLQEKQQKEEQKMRQKDEHKNVKLHKNERRPKKGKEFREDKDK
jgi:GTPase